MLDQEMAFSEDAHKDALVNSLQQIDPAFPATWMLKGMTRQQYWSMQNAARKLAEQCGIPPIWFEDAWVS